MTYFDLQVAIAVCMVAAFFFPIPVPVAVQNFAARTYPGSSELLFSLYRVLCFVLFLCFLYLCFFSLVVVFFSDEYAL